MKKFLIVTLAAVALLGFAGSSFALLCASDPVPAGTLLFPFCTAKYAPTATSTDPVVDYNEAVTLFAITNVSASPRIVHNVLWNDFSVPLLDWDVLLTGYDVITFNFGRILEGYLVPTGPGNNAATGRPYSPTGSQPQAQGPVPSFWAGIPSLPTPGGVGTTANNTASIFGLCTNPVYTTPFTVDPQRQANRIPEYNRARIFNGMRASQTIAENGTYGNQPPAFVPPTWLLNRSTNDNVWGYITSDVVAACGFGFPGSDVYHGIHGRPYTTSLYANNIASNFWVDLGNTLIGDWFVVDSGENGAQGAPAVHIEFDNQDVINSLSYPKTVQSGASFYRYTDPECDPQQGYDIFNCTDFYTGTGTGSDWTSGSAYFFGPADLTGIDYREPLPSAFAFRWMDGGGFDGGTKIRVWKEFPDVYPYYGFTYIYSGLQYAYYAWDEEEHVLTSTGGCDVSPCATTPGEINQLPLEIQEVDMDNFNLPKSYMTFGWALFAFLGSNTLYLSIPFGFSTPVPNTFGTQAWIEVLYTAGGRYSVDLNAAVLGNFLCDGLSVTWAPRSGIDETDLGDVLY